MSSFFALWRKYVIYYEAKVKGAQQWINQSVWRYQKVLSDKERQHFLQKDFVKQEAAHKETAKVRVDKSR